MSVDPVISADLVALAREGRADLPTLDQMLRPRPAAARLDAIDVLAHRVARVAAGATALTATAVMLVALHAPGAVRTFGDDSVAIVAGLGLLVLASWAVGGALAWRSTTRWRARAAALDRLAVALPIAGLGGLVTLVGALAASLGRRAWDRVFDHEGVHDLAITSRLHQVTFAVIGVVAAGAVVGWAATRRPAWLGVLRRPGARVVGAAIAIVTVIAWHRLGAEAWGWDAPAAPVTPVRGVLVASFAFASFVAIASITLRRRAREQLVEDADPAAIARAPAVRRLSRIVSGGVAWLAMLALAIGLHPSLRGAGWRFEPMTLARVALGWPHAEAPDRTAFAIDLGLVVVIAYLVAGRLAARLGDRVRAPDSWAVAATIAGAGAVACVFGVTAPVVGASFGAFFTEYGERGAAVLTATVHAMTIGITVSGFVAVRVGRAVRRGPSSCLVRYLARPQLGVAGIGFAAVSWLAGHRLDLDIQRISVSASLASPARVVAALGAVWTAAILTVIAHRAVRGCARRG